MTRYEKCKSQVYKASSTQCSKSRWLKLWVSAFSVGLYRCVSLCEGHPSLQVSFRNHDPFPTSAMKGATRTLKHRETVFAKSHFVQVRCSCRQRIISCRLLCCCRSPHLNHRTPTSKQTPLPHTSNPPPFPFFHICTSPSARGTKAKENTPKHHWNLPISFAPRWSPLFAGWVDLYFRPALYFSMIGVL